MKLACTLVSAAMVTLQVGAKPEHDPPQPVKLAPAPGVAVSVTVVPCWNLAEQLLPQLINVENSPLGVPLIDPLPPRPMDRLYTVVKVAVTLRAPFAVTVQVVCVPVQAPPHPLNTPLEGGAAVKVTLDPPATVVVQMPPQLILPLAPVTLPLPTLTLSLIHI